MTNLSILRGMTDNYEAYDTGQRLLGITTVDLPDFNFLTDEVSGPGVMGNLALPAIAHTESLELSLNWRTINEDLTYLLIPHAHDFSLRSGQHNYDVANGITQSQPIRIDFRGLTKGMPLGKLEKAAETESKTTFELIVLAIYVDNAQKLYYDKLNYIFKIDGADYLADYRSSVGLTSTRSEVTFPTINGAL